MFPGLILPLLAATVLAITVTTAHRYMPPALASRMLAVSVVVVAGAAVPTLWLLSFGYISYVGHLPYIGRWFAWCAETIGIHETIPHWIGLPAVIVAAIGAVRTTRILRLHRRLRQDRPGSIEIAGHDAVFAFTLPGRAGQVVLSSGLVSLLDPEEQMIVLAHERAHGRHRHDRYLLMGQLASASTPFLRPLVSRLQFSLERWADEEAVVAGGGDRRFVAFTLGKVALNTLAPLGALSFAGLGVPARVTALLSPPPSEPGASMLIGIWAMIGVTAMLAVTQLHHLATLLADVCPG